MPKVKSSVYLLTYTPEPEQIVGAACRLCYSKVGAKELKEKMSKEEIRKLLKIVFKSGHHSVFEHPSFTFGIDGISRACSHQIVRHRIASYSQQSQRYVKYDDPNYIVPPDIEGTEKEQIFESRISGAAEGYKELMDQGFKPEDARYLLPNATETKMVATFNARSLFNFITLRTCERAQWEIRILAEEMLKLVLPTAPIIFENYGPHCVRGLCPEGTFYCGKPRGVTKNGLVEISEEEWKHNRHSKGISSSKEIIEDRIKKGKENLDK